MTYSGYDNVGNLRQRYDARGANATYTYTYDTENRLKSVVAPENPSNTPSDDVTFTYDGWGNRSVATNASVTRTYTYRAHRLLETSDLVRPDGTAASERRFTTRYEYDERDNLTAIVYPSGRRIKYTVDSADRVTKVEEERSPSNRVLATELTYHASGALSTYKAGNDLLTSVTVDALSRPDVLTVGGTPLLRLDYGYDGFGNVESLEDSQTTCTHAFTYDKVDRLLGATWGSETLTHTYDAVGNRLTRTRGTTVTYTYDGVTNRLASYTGGAALGYDGLGQVTSWTRPDGGGTDTYTYNQMGLIRTAGLASQVAMTYAYDADHLRTIAKAGGSETRAFVHGPGGRSITEYRLTSGRGATWVRDDIYLGDRLLASVLASSTVTVSGIDPDSSAVAGGTTVTITGTGFVAGATSVWIGGEMATGVQVDGQGMTLTAVTPAHAPGPVEVVVTTAGGSGSLTGAFSYRNVALNRWLGSDSDYASDVSVYRPSTGYWYVLPSDGSVQLSWQFGQPAHNDQPLRGDFDGDGLRDPAVYRPASGTWFALLSDTDYLGYLAYGWGVQAEGDTPAPGDFDGDGKTDLCVFPPGTGTWYILESHAAYTTWSWFGWGTAGDILMPGDYDGDGKTDGAVYRPSTGMWYIRRSTDGAQWIKEFGEPAQGDIPLPGDFDGDGQRDLVVYRPSTGTWFWLQSSSGFTRYGQVGWGLASQGDEPVPGDYDGDGKTDPTVFRPQYGTWFILTSSSGYGAWVQQGWGAPGDIALGGRR